METRIIEDTQKRNTKSNPISQLAQTTALNGSSNQHRIFFLINDPEHYKGIKHPDINQYPFGSQQRPTRYWAGLFNGSQYQFDSRDLWRRIRLRAAIFWSFYLGTVAFYHWFQLTKYIGYLRNSAVCWTIDKCVLWTIFYASFCYLHRISG